MTNRFCYKSAAELALDCQRLNTNLEIRDDISALGQPLMAAGRELTNPLVLQPMEGCDGNGDGSPSKLTLRRYQRYAAGGAGVIWFEATAVTPEGRGNPRQLMLNEQTLDSFRQLVAATRQAAPENTLLLLQLTHSGRYSKPQGKRAPVIVFNDPYLDEASEVQPQQLPISDNQLDQLMEQYGQAALLAQKAGFDGVDIKACHRYLISELLAGHTRRGRYGGSLDNRVRFLVDTISAIRRASGDQFVLAVRLNAWDALPWPYGWGVARDNPHQPDLTEPKLLAGTLSQAGVSIINISAGNPYFIPHVGRPFERPVLGGSNPKEHPLTGVSRLLDFAAEIQQAAPDVAVVGSGYSWLRQFFPQVAAAELARGRSRLVGLGRMAFACPQAPRLLQEQGRLSPQQVCTACSMCTQIMRDGGRTGCVIRDGQVYVAEYKAGREKA